MNEKKSNKVLRNLRIQRSKTIFSCEQLFFEKRNKFEFPYISCKMKVMVINFIRGTKTGVKVKKRKLNFHFNFSKKKEIPIYIPSCIISVLEIK